MCASALRSLENNVHTFDVQGAVCAPWCAKALGASLQHYRWISWPLYMRRYLDGVVGDVGYWRFPKLLSVLRPAPVYERILHGEFNESAPQLRDRAAPRVRERLAALAASEREAWPPATWRSWRSRVPQRVREPVDCARGTLGATEAAELAAAAARNDNAAAQQLVRRRIADGRFVNWTALHSEPLAILFLPAADAGSNSERSNWCSQSQENRIE